MYKAIQIKDNIYWVGAFDYNLRHFHGEMYPIEEGASYNAFLIVDEKITLIDTVEEAFFDQMLARIQSVIKDRPIDTVIVQHAEPDHSGGFQKLMNLYPQIQPYASNAGAQIMLKQYFKQYNFIKVKTNDTLCLGAHTLTFIEMPMIHWPDNMMSYESTSNILFSNDAFGQHILSHQLLDSFHDRSYCIDKAKEYYANIVMPYGMQVLKRLDFVNDLDLSIDMIAPAHGVLWKSYIPEILEVYRDFASFTYKNKAIIVYESVWEHTSMMANALAEGFGQANVDVKVFVYSKTSSALIMKELLDARFILVGSGNYNSGMATSIAGFLSKLKTLHLQAKIGCAFGSYGWGAKIVEEMQESLQKANIQIATCPNLNQNYTPNDNDINELIMFANALAKKELTIR